MLRSAECGINYVHLLIRSYLWVAKKKPGFWGSGVAVGAKKPGFCCGDQELSVECEQETRFLSFWAGCWEKETGFLL